MLGQSARCKNNEDIIGLFRAGRPFALLSLIIVFGFLGLRTALAQEDGSFTLPFSDAEPWYICRGYNIGGHIAVQKFALDLSVHPDSDNPNGCNPLTSNASTGRDVLAPASGKVVLHQGDGMCINFDNGKSMFIGHLDNRSPVNKRVARDEKIGTVAPPRESNGNYAHIHIQVHPGLGCASAGHSVPFDDAYGTRFQSAPSLPNIEDNRNQWSGQSLTRPTAAIASHHTFSCELSALSGIISVAPPLTC